MPDPKNKKNIKVELSEKVDNTRANNLKMVLEKHKRQSNKPIDVDRKILDNKFKKGIYPEMIINPINMGSPLYGKISSACKAAAKRKFKVWPSAYASGWGVRCTKAGGPQNYGNKKK